MYQIKYKQTECELKFYMLPQIIVMSGIRKHLLF